MKHGIYTIENATPRTAPVACESAVPVVIGTAPINQLDDPLSAVNKPILATSAAEAMQALGYQSNSDGFTLCDMMYIQSNMYVVQPIIYINVLDPRRDKKAFEAQTLPVEFGQATLRLSGVLREDLKVSIPASAEGGEDTPLTIEADYSLAYDDDGSLLVNIAGNGAGKDASLVKVEGARLDPSMVTGTNVIGMFNVSTGEVSGMEVIKQVYSKFNIVPTILLAPGFSEDPEVAIALQAKAKAINSMFPAIALIDVDTSEDGARIYTDVKETKETQGITSENGVALWPYVRAGNRTMPYSAAYAGLLAYTDASNGNVPYESPSNLPIAITGICLADGTEVDIDRDQANVVNEAGVVTAINLNGWRAWGNYTAAYPGTGDPKDMWICTKRMFYWARTSFILNYITRVDRIITREFIDSFIDNETIRMSKYVNNKQIAGFEISYEGDLNPTTDIMAGRVTFSILFVPFTPAQEINGVFSYDLELLDSYYAGVAA